MTDFDTSRLLRALSTLAQKTVQKEAGQQEVIVLSKNPDGTVNVDDGSGGCVRVLGFQNAKIGTKIRLTQPPLGTLTKEPPRFIDLPPPYNPPEFPPTRPADVFVYSDEVASWGADNIAFWSGRADYGVWTKVAGAGFYNRLYWNTFSSIDRTSGVASKTSRKNKLVTDIQGYTTGSGLDIGMNAGRTLFRYPRLDAVIPDDRAIKSAFIDVNLQARADKSPGASIIVLEWEGIGTSKYTGDVGTTVVNLQSIDYPNLPYASTEPGLRARFLDGFIGSRVLGSLPLKGQTTSGSFPIQNRIPLNAFGIAALQRKKSTVLAFLISVDLNGLPPNGSGTTSELPDLWQPWVAELPGRHAPKKARILASDPTPPSPEPYNQTRLRLTLADA